MSTPEQVLAELRSIVVDNSERVSLEISAQFRKRSEEVQRNHFGGDFETGFLYLYGDEHVHSQKVMETVMSPRGDAITSIYIGHPIFSSIGELVKARRRLIRALSQKVGLSPEAMGIDDEARGRVLSPTELSTGQLIDLLAERMGKSVVVSNSHGGNTDLVKVPT